MCGPRIAMVLFDASRWPITIVKCNFFDVEGFSLLTKDATTCGILSQQSFEMEGCASLWPYLFLVNYTHGEVT